MVAERHALDAAAISDQSADVRTVEYRVIDRYGDITIIWRYHDNLAIYRFLREYIAIA